MYSVLTILSLIFICVLILASYLLRSVPFMLLAIGFTIFVFLHFSRETFTVFQDPKATDLHQRLITVFPNAAAVKVSGSNESFTLNKNHIHLCLRDKEGQYYDDNSLMYVLLHEYAHVLCDEVDEGPEHKPKFRAIFSHLLDQAAAAGIYDPNKPMIANYCGY